MAKDWIIVLGNIKDRRDEVKILDIPMFEIFYCGQLEKIHQKSKHFVQIVLYLLR